jgi:hypothetical protein
MLCMNIVQSQANLFQNCLSCLYRKDWIILYQRKQIALKVLVNKYIFIFIIVYVDSEARIITKLVFELLQEIKD